MLKQRYTPVLVALSVLIALVGCTRVQTPAPTVTSGPTVIAPLVTEAECPRTELENYLQRSNSLVQEFTDTVNIALKLPPAAMNIVVDRVASLQGALRVLQAPGCAQSHQEMVLLIVERAFVMFDEFGKGAPIDLAAFVVEVNQALDSIKTRELELNLIYERLPQ